MSSWALVTRAIYRFGPTTSPKLEMHTEGAFDVGAALSLARVHGLVVSPGRCVGGRAGNWSLTQRGIDWCEGRLRLIPKPHSGPGRPGYRFAATWLMSLPRDVSIKAQRATEREMETA